MQVTCPYCGSKKVMRRGSHPKQRYQCTDNKHPDGTSRYFYNETSPMNVLLFDIETLPIEFYGWKLWDKITSPEFIKRDWCLLSYAAKWLFTPSHVSGVLTPKEAKERNDQRLVEEVWRLFNKADIIIAHNGLDFDIPRMNTKFLMYDLVPPSPYQVIDTLKTVQKVFGNTSNALDYLGRYYGLGRKHHTDFQLWVDCDNGNKDALSQMLAYNARDIYLLEDVYVKIRPWIKHPNMALFVTTDQLVCPRCGSEDLDTDGLYTTGAGVFQSFRCNNCGALGRHKTRKRTTPIRVI